MINAFKKVKTEKKLVIAGGSSDTQAYEEEIKKQAEGDARIIFTGFVQGRMLEELYSNAIKPFRSHELWKLLLDFGYRRVRIGCRR